MAARLASVNLLARDVDALLAFYVGVFGWLEKTEQRGPYYRALDAGGTVIGFNAQEAYALLNLADQSEPTGVRSLLTVDVDDRDQVQVLTDRAVTLGASLARPPYDTAYGSRQSVLHDPQGNVFRINAF